MALNNYTVTLEVREVRILAIELEDVVTVSEDRAIEIASNQYERTGRSEFTIELTDGGADEVLGATTELMEEDE